MSRAEVALLNLATAAVQATALPLLSSIVSGQSVRGGRRTGPPPTRDQTLENCCSWVRGTVDVSGQLDSESLERTASN